MELEPIPVTEQPFTDRIIRQPLRIPDDTWHTMEPRLKEVIDALRISRAKKRQAKSEDNEDNKKYRTGKMLAARTHTQDNGPFKKNYAISDSGADSCCLGKHCHPVSYTGRYAILEGYNPDQTRSGQIPIVTAYIKAMSQLDIPIVLQVNEAPYMNDSQTTLISEYQVREHGISIDSVAKHHKTAHGTLGYQHMTLSEHVYLPFVDRGGIMGFEILPWEEGDENIYAIFEITGNAPWKPCQFQETEDASDKNMNTKKEIQLTKNSTSTTHATLIPDQMGHTNRTATPSRHCDPQKHPKSSKQFRHASLTHDSSNNYYEDQQDKHPSTHEKMRHHMIDNFGHTYTEQSLTNDDPDEQDNISPHEQAPGLFVPQDSSSNCRKIREVWTHQLGIQSGRCEHKAPE